MNAVVAVQLLATAGSSDDSRRCLVSDEQVLAAEVAAVNVVGGPLPADKAVAVTVRFVVYEDVGPLLHPEVDGFLARLSFC